MATKVRYEDIEDFLGRFEKDVIIKEITDSFVKYNTPLEIDELKEEIAAFLSDTSMTVEEKNEYIKSHMELRFAEDSMYLNWLKLEGDKLPGMNDDLRSADYQELGMERESLVDDIATLRRELKAKEKRLAGIKQEIKRRDEGGDEEEKCSTCTSPAPFDQSPEGESCGLCQEWVCRDCVDASVSAQKYVLSDGRIIREDVICKSCAELLGLHALTPVLDEAKSYRVNFSVMKNGDVLHNGSIKLVLESESEEHIRMVLSDQPLADITNGILDDETTGITFEINGIQ